MSTPSPFVVGIHDLSRRPGASRTLDLRIPAPQDLAIEVIGVPEGSELEVDVRLDSLVEGVLATGTVRAELVGECVRCLTTINQDLEVDVTELFAYPGAIEIDPDDEEAEDIREIVGETIDLEQSVRDAVVLALPFQPRCRPDCAGLCVECGVDLNEAGPEHSHEVVDPRWAALVSAFAADAAPASEATTDAAPATERNTPQQDVPQATGAADVDDQDVP